MHKDALVPALYEREPDSVPGPFYVVKDICITCGLPRDEAPHLIQWTEEHELSDCAECDNHCRVSRQPETPEEIEQMIQAAGCSCNGSGSLLRRRSRNSGEIQRVANGASV